MSPTSADYFELGAWRSITTLDDLHHWAETDPGHTAIVTKYVNSGTETSVSVGDLDRAVRRTALGLLDFGVQRGDVVSFQLPHWWEFSVIYYACLQVGAIANPIGMISREKGVAHSLTSSRSKLFFVPGRYRNFDYVTMAMALRGSLSTLDEVFVVQGGEVGGAAMVPSGAKSFGDCFLDHPYEQADNEALDALASRADEIVLLKYTSGTTGEPKGVLHSSNSLYAATYPVPKMMELGASDVVAIPAPLVHMSGLLYGVLMPITWRMKAVFLDVWDARALAKAIESESATWTIGATPYAIDLLDVMADADIDISSLQLFACSGAPVPRYLTQVCREQLGIELRGIWGMTETGGVTFVPRDDRLGKAEGTDGVAPLSMEVKVVDASGATLGPDEEGALRVRGASTFAGYFERPALTAATLDEDGWVNTGDLASMDSDGYIRISGREKDLIIRGGENIPVVEIEDALYQHPSVREVAVVGYADARLGERALAVVVSRDDQLSLEELCAHLANLGVAKHFWPERLEIIDEMPHTDAGKIQKFVLRQRFSGNEIWGNSTRPH